MAYALAYLGTLALVGWCLWLYRQHVPADDLRRLRDLSDDVRQLRSVVETLAVARGLDPPWRKGKS